LQIPIEVIESGLFADLKSEQRLMRFEDLSAERLLLRYNLALAQGVLLKAVRVDVEIRRETPARPPMTRRSLILAGAACVACSLPGLVPAVALVADRPSGEMGRLADEIQVFDRLKHHLDPLQFPTAAYVAYAIVLVAWLFGRRVVVLAGVVGLMLITGFVASRLGSEFLPELDEGDIVIFVEMPPSIALDRGGQVLTEVRRRLLAFPEALETLSEQGRPEDGTDDEGVNMSETFVRVAPRDKWRPGWTKDRLYEAMRASLTEIPGGRVMLTQMVPSFNSGRNSVPSCGTTARLAIKAPSANPRTNRRWRNAQAQIQLPVDHSIGFVYFIGNIGYAAGHFLAAGGYAIGRPPRWDPNAQVFNSSDGANWKTLISEPGFTFGPMAVGEDRFLVFVVLGGPARGMMLRPLTDGTWQKETAQLPGIGITATGYGAGAFVVLDGTAFSSRSLDGVNWTGPVPLTGLTTEETGPPLKSIAFGRGNWVGVGPTGLIATSRDATNWSFADRATSLPLTSNNEYSVVVGACVKDLAGNGVPTMGTVGNSCFAGAIAAIPEGQAGA
jgi:hypothetical protein